MTFGFDWRWGISPSCDYWQVDGTGYSLRFNISWQKMIGCMYNNTYSHTHIYIYTWNTVWPFFAVIWPNTAEFGEMTIFLGHMPIFGGIWRQVACLKNIDKYWKHIENILKSCKIEQYWNILKNYWKHIGNILEKYSCHDYPRMRAT